MANEMDQLREAMNRAARVEEINKAAEAIIWPRNKDQEISSSIFDVPAAPPNEDERQHLIDVALADVIEIGRRRREALGRHVCSPHDAMIIRQMYELLISMRGLSLGSDNDPSFK